MDRRDFLRIAALAGGALSLGRMPSSMAQDEGERPNLLVILTDDQPPHTLYRMPKTLDLLAEIGADLTPQGYVAVPVCGPARVSLLTGRFPHNHGVLENEGDYRIYRKRHYARDDLLSRISAAGYRVGYFGKFLNNYGDQPRWVHPAADAWAALASGSASDTRTVNFNGHLREIRGNETRYLSEKAENFVRDKTGPFLCYLALTDPHVPYRPSRAHAHDFDGERYTSPGVEEEDTSDKSSWIGGRYKAKPRELQNRYEGILEELQDTDDCVRRILSALEEEGQLGNTLIVFTSDNGYMLGEHGGLVKKGAPYEEACRVPFVIRGPGTPTKPPQGLVSHVDVTATLLDAAGASMNDLDGRSLYRLFSGGTWRKRLLVEHPHRGWWMVREGRLVYTEFSTGEREMYDLDADPYQRDNLLAETPSAETEQKASHLSARLDDLRRSAGDRLRAAEGET